MCRCGEWVCAFFACVVLQQMLMTCRSMSISVPKPQFQFIRRLRLKASLHLHAVSVDRMVLLDGEMHIYVWNRTSNIAVTWKLEGLDPAYDVCHSLPL